LAGWPVPHLSPLADRPPEGRRTIFTPSASWRCLIVLWTQRKRSRAPWPHYFSSSAFFRHFSAIFSFSYQRYSFVGGSLSIPRESRSLLRWLPLASICCRTGGGWFLIRRRHPVRRGPWQRCGLSPASTARHTRTWGRSPEPHWLASRQFGSLAITWASVLGGRREADGSNRFVPPSACQTKSRIRSWPLQSWVARFSRRDGSKKRWSSTNKPIRLEPDLASPPLQSRLHPGSPGQVCRSHQAVSGMRFGLEPCASEVPHNLGVAPPRPENSTRQSGSFSEPSNLRPSSPRPTSIWATPSRYRETLRRPIPQYEEALRFDPKNASAHYDLAIATGQQRGFGAGHRTVSRSGAGSIGPAGLFIAHWPKCWKNRGCADEAQREFVEAQRRGDARFSKKAQTRVPHRSP